jgi:uncharacterized protein YqjF (DUF2071 family)
MFGVPEPGHPLRVVSTAPDHRVRLPALRAEWRKQTFVHWAYPPDDVQALLPDGLVVDEYDGAAWVSLTPFLMARARPPGVPAGPRFPTFPETNLRTYVRRPDGRDGLWFLSIEVARAAMLAARAVGVPYHLADLTVSPRGDTTAYAGSRRGGEPSYRLVVRPGGPIVPSGRDIWLTGRWRAYSHRLGVLFETPVWHEPWQLSGGTVEDLWEDLTTAVGLPAPSGEPLVHYSEGVRHVGIGVARPARLYDIGFPASTVGHPDRVPRGGRRP